MRDSLARDNQNGKSVLRARGAQIQDGNLPLLSDCSCSRHSSNRSYLRKVLHQKCYNKYSEGRGPTHFRLGTRRRKQGVATPGCCSKVSDAPDNSRMKLEGGGELRKFMQDAGAREGLRASHDFFQLAATERASDDGESEDTSTHWRSSC